ncbi:MAG: zinc dependent phospholipase C family protein [Eubacteriales bacterium]|nr:zinc dependent phospholipase C family protein [Eubacteriales bacterium]
MRKKSHVSLSVYLVDVMDSQLLEEHKKAFIMGSILPDCKPSFVTTKHNMKETFDMVCEAIKELANASGDDFKTISTAYCRKLGEVTHYLADYFTFPHNEVFEGNIREHCSYEKKLKFALREYIDSSNLKVPEKCYFGSAKELLEYVKNYHRQYLMTSKSVESDCMYIVRLCYTVVVGILSLMNRNRIQAAA